MKQIKFGTVKIGQIARQYINECLESNHLTYGPKCVELENRWAKLFYTNYAVNVCSGTAANTAALLTLYTQGAKRGQNIIVPGLSFVATASSVIFSGFVPKYCDIRKETLVIDENLIENLIDENTVGIMPVTLMGAVPNMQRIMEICHKHNLWLIVDNCEGAGCKYRGSFVEHYAHMSTMSMYAAHLVFGVQNGIVSTNIEELRDGLLSVRSHGRKPHSLFFSHDYLGNNFMPTDIHASIALEQIDHFWVTFNIRRNNWQTTRKELACLEDIVYFCDEQHGNVHSPHAFSITLKTDDYNIKGLTEHLENSGVQVKRNFGAQFQHKALQGLGLNENCPNAEWVGDNGIHWGIHQYMTTDDCLYVTNKVKEFFGR